MSHFVVSGTCVSIIIAAVLKCAHAFALVLILIAFNIVTFHAAILGTADGGTVVKVLCYKSVGRWFGSMVSLEFFIDIILPIALWPWG
jgi:hypothetical protein